MLLVTAVSRNFHPWDAGLFADHGNLVVELDGALTVRSVSGT